MIKLLLFIFGEYIYKQEEQIIEKRQKQDKNLEISAISRVPQMKHKKKDSK